MRRPAREEIVYSRRTMIVTGLQVAGVILAAGLILHPLLTRDIEAHKVGQRVDRAMKYLLMAEGSLSAWQDKTGAPMASRDGALPTEEFIDWFAKRRGGQPLFREEGRVSRLDMFGPSGPFIDPLLYRDDGASWVLASRGPDGDFDVPDDALAANAEERLAVLAYDPTNGIYSSGDLWVGRFSPEGP